MNVNAHIRIGLLAFFLFNFSQQIHAESFLDKLLEPAVPVLHDLFPKTSEELLSEKDEAKKAFEAGALSEDQYKKLVAGSAVDFFREMDNGFTMRPTELQKTLSPFMPGISEKEAVDRMARGRNNWIVWTFGNDNFWNGLGRATFGGLDFLKTLSSHPLLPSSRMNRWESLGLVNEPCFKQATAPREDRWGLMLDERIVSEDCPADPFEDASVYPGIKTGARGTQLTYKGKKKLLEIGSFYGYPTGVVGFRLFPNPDFDQAAADRWDPKKFYEDPAYFNDPKTVRPYRVGVSCALCHVGPNPKHPPTDFNNPKWADLNSNPGAQYFWVDRIFMWNWKNGQDSFVYQLLHTSRPGALDTSLISSDQINNPRTMNAVYDFPARLAVGAKFNSSELLTGNETLNMQFSQLGKDRIWQNSPLSKASQTTSQGKVVLSPRVLKDGSDSVGALGALNRVYVNIGLFGEEWVRHFIPLIGGPALTPFPIKVANENSLYWQANIQQTPDLALFFLASAKPDKLADAPGGKELLKDFESPQLGLGKKVFAENCAGCHSSKLPEKAYSFFNNSKSPDACRGENYLKCWNSYWDYIKGSEFKSEMAKIVTQKDFLNDNFLSTDLRVPVSLTDSQLCSPIGTNAIKGDIWDNFSSTSYKELPSIGDFTVNYPLDMSSVMKSETIQVPDGGRGFLRPPSLISAWSSAPFLQNNALGLFDGRGTVEGRMASFNDSITKLLNPEQRASPGGPFNIGSATKSVLYQTNSGSQLPGHIDVTTKESYIKIPRGYLPNFIFDVIKKANLADPIAKKNFLKKGYDYVNFGSAKQKSLKSTAQEKEKRNLASMNMLAATGDAKEIGSEIFIGPIPAGTPVNLISNINLAATPVNTFKLNVAIFKLVTTTIQIRKQQLKGPSALNYFMTNAAPSLLQVSKCADFVVDRGHYFGTQYAPNNKETGSSGLSPDEKTALIEYIKYF